jgi:hypothetical protein
MANLTPWNPLVTRRRAPQLGLRDRSLRFDSLRRAEYNFSAAGLIGNN